MKRVDASRPGLSLPIRLSVLALVTLSGAVGVAAIFAKQNGTDIVSSLTTLDFAKAYRQENINYTLAEAKLKLGDLKGAATLIKTLIFDPSSESYLSYTELRTALVRAQIAADAFDDAIQSAQGDKPLQSEVLRAQLRRKDLDSVVKTASFLSDPDRSTVLTGLAYEWGESGQLPLAERIVAQIDPSIRSISYGNLAVAYYKSGQREKALSSLQRITDQSRLEMALLQLGGLCVTAKDTDELRRLLALLPKEPSERKRVRVAHTNQFAEVATPSGRQQLLQQCVNTPDSLEENLGLIRDFAHPQDQPDLLRSLGSWARSKRDAKTAYAALALLRQQTSEHGKEVYDQEAHSLLSSDLEPLSDSLTLAESIQNAELRQSALLILGQRAKTASELQPILLAFRKLSSQDANSRHDSCIQQLLNRVEQQSPAQAKALAQQLLDPAQRKQVLASLTARHP